MSTHIKEDYTTEIIYNYLDIALNCINMILDKITIYIHNYRTAISNKPYICFIRHRVNNIPKVSWTQAA